MCQATSACFSDIAFSNKKSSFSSVESESRGSIKYNCSFTLTYDADISSEQTKPASRLSAAQRPVIDLTTSRSPSPENRARTASASMSSSVPGELKVLLSSTGTIRRQEADGFVGKSIASNVSGPSGPVEKHQVSTSRPSV